MAFLRSMGWRDDDDVAPLTDEEIREYLQLSGRPTKQLQDKKKFSNGFKVISPSAYSPPAGSALSCSSYSSSDSEADS